MADRLDHVNEIVKARRKCLGEIQAMDGPRRREEPTQQILDAIDELAAEIRELRDRMPMPASSSDGGEFAHKDPNTDI